jgi:DNA-binding transcriptional LysR family regulator
MKRYNPVAQVTEVDAALRDIRLRDMELFSGAARLRSFRLAARAFQVEASQISRTAKRIEKQVGKRLFSRSASGVSLTPAGERVNQTFKSIMDQSRLLRGDRSAAQKEPTFYGIASANYLIQNLLPEALSQISSDRPEVRFRLLELFPDEMLLPGLRGAFEICLHAGAIDWPSTWYSTTVGSIEWGFFVKADHPLVARAKGKKGILSAEELVEYPFILPFDFSIDNGFRVRDDRSPIPMSLKYSGYELQRADVAAEILTRTFQVAHLPSLVATKYLVERKLCYLRLQGERPVEVPLILSVQAALVSKKTTQSLVDLLSKLLKTERDTFDKFK